MIAKEFLCNPDKIHKECLEQLALSIAGSWNANQFSVPSVKKEFINAAYGQLSIIRNLFYIDSGESVIVEDIIIDKQIYDDIVRTNSFPKWYKP